MWDDITEEAKEALLKQAEESETYYQFAPFDPPETCDKEYPGIETQCGAPATHKLVIKHRLRTEEIVRCDEHGFPWAVRARRERMLGHPLCQACAHRDLTKQFLPNDPVGTFESTNDDGEIVTAYACDACEKHFDLDLEAL